MSDIFKESKIRPDSKDAPQDVGHLETKDFFDEIIRRLDILGQTKFILQGLGLRLMSDTAMDVRERIEEDSGLEKHQAYLDSIDIYPDIAEGGFQIGVDIKNERDALIAEMGTTTSPKQDLWRPLSLSSEVEYIDAIKEFFKLLADKFKEGKSFSVDDIDEVVEENDIPDNIMPEYHRLLSEYGLASKREEVK